jgi:hypothetical protein
MVVQVYNPSTWEAEAGLQVQAQPRLCSQTMSQNTHTHTHTHTHTKQNQQQKNHWLNQGRGFIRAMGEAGYGDTQL